MATSIRNVVVCALFLGTFVYFVMALCLALQLVSDTPHQPTMLYSPPRTESVPEANTADDFVQILNNRYSHHRINCTGKSFKYFNLIHQQLQSVYDLSNRTMITSEYISNTVIQPDEIKFSDAPRHPFLHLRLKFIGGKLYFSRFPSTVNPKSDSRWTWWMYFYMRLAEKYGDQIPDTDFIVFIGDAARRRWNYDRFPFFVGDGAPKENEELAKRGMVGKQLPLLTIPRSYYHLRQCPFGGGNYADVVCYRDADGYSFGDRRNQAVFRGSATGGDWDKSKRGRVIIASTDENFTAVDAKFRRTGLHRVDANEQNETIRQEYMAESMSSRDQMKYKYILVIDGNSVRDGYPTQLGFGSVVLKQKSTFSEFWYWDIVDKEHVIEWTEYRDLKQLVVNLTNIVEPYSVERQKEIAQNGRRFVDEYLVDECVDCFVMHMIELYNRYFFDSASVQLDPYDILINESTIKEMMDEGSMQQIYHREYVCPVTNTTIVAQRLKD